MQEDFDEVLSELKRCHEELDSVATKNKKILQHLLQITKTEFRRQQIKNQLKIINSEVRLNIELNDDYSTSVLRVLCGILFLHSWLM